MKEGVLRRLKEIEDYMEAAKKLESPPTSWHDIAWLCQTMRQLVARLEKLEAVAEAARAFHDAIYNEKNVYETWPDIMERQEVYEAGNRLRKALAALEEVKE